MDGGLADHVPHVYRLALRLTRDIHRAEDLTQETFLRAWQRCQQLKNKQAVRTWLFRIAVNLMNDEFRRTNSSSSRTSALTDELNCSRPTPDHAAESNDELDYALKLLDTLPTRQRVVLFLATVEELSLSEICEILGITMTTAKANLSLARKRMRNEFAKRKTEAHQSIQPRTSHQTADTDD